MKKKIQDMIDLLKSNDYDEEATHADYDRLLEEFIRNYDKKLLPLMLELLGTNKVFWYA